MVTAIFAVLIVALIGLAIQCAIYASRIKEIRRVMGALSRGDFSSRMALSPSDQMGDVARHISELSQGIQKRIAEVTNEKEKLEAILSSMAEGVVIVSHQEKIVHMSPSFLNMFDVRSAEWLNKHYWEVIANQQINESIREAMTHRQIVRKEIVLVHPVEMFFEMLISPVLDANNALLSIVAVFHDVTELKKYERLRTEFVANVSHELKTPLTSIKGFVETLKSGAIEDKANAVRFLDIIGNQTQRLEYLVNDLLVLSSLESKEVKFDLTLINIESIINSVVLMKKKDTDERRHTVSVHIEPKTPAVLMDARRMEQVFLNLLENAVKFTPNGGKIEIRAAVEGQNLRVDVIDNGRGIARENLSRIFERFFRTDKSRTQETGGTGLGLSIVKHIVEAHHGQVTVESTLGIGSRFSVFLPLNML